MSFADENDIMEMAEGYILDMGLDQNGEVIGYKMPIWQIFLIVIDCVIVVGVAVWGFFVIRKALKAKDDEASDAAKAE